MTRKDVISQTALEFRKSCIKYYKSKGIGTDPGSEGFPSLQESESNLIDLLHLVMNRIDKIVPNGETILPKHKLKKD